MIKFWSTNILASWCKAGIAMGKEMGAKLGQVRQKLKIKIASVGKFEISQLFCKPLSFIRA